MRILLTAICGFVLSVQVFAQGPSKEGPSALSPLFYQAETYRITGRTSLAADAYMKLLEQEPTHEAALYQLGRMLLQTGDYLGAQTVLKSGHDAHPDNEWMLQLLALSEAKLGHFSTAIDAFKTLHLQRPDKPEYLEAALDAAVNGEEFYTADQIVQTYEATYGQTPETAQQRVGYLLKANDLKAATNVLKLATKTHPEVPEYIGLLSQLYAGNDLDKKAIKVLEKGIETHPRNGPLHLEKARILQKLGKWDAASESIHKAFEVEGVPLSTKGSILIDFLGVAQKDASFQVSFDELWEVARMQHEEELGWQLVLAERLRIEDQSEAAVAAYLQAVRGGIDQIEVIDAALQVANGGQLKPQALELIDIMYEVYGHDSQIAKYIVGQWANLYAWEKCAPLAAEQAALTLDPEEKHWLHSTSGYGYYQSKNMTLAVEQYEKSLKIKRDAQTLNNYAWALAKNDLDLDKALLLSAESNAKEKDQPLYLDTWALVLYKLGEFEQAQEKMELALQLVDSAPTPNMLQLAAKIEEALGNKSKALIYREQATQQSDK